MAVDRLALTVTLNMTYVNYISLIDLSMRGILYPVMLRQLTRYGCNMHMHRVPEKRDYVFDGKRNFNCPFTKCVTTLARVIVSIESTITLVHAFVASRVDCFCSLLFGSPKTVTDKLQRVLRPVYSDTTQLNSDLKARQRNWAQLNSTRRRYLFPTLPFDDTVRPKFSLC